MSGVEDELCIEVSDIEVIDNGKGIADNIIGSGLTNLERRAEEVGGFVTVQDTPERATRLRWSAPLP